MNVPERWQAYDCGSYFLSPLAESGWWDERAQCWYIEPAERVYEDVAREFLIIGRPGVDGIAWGFRRGRDGVWAYYPVDGTFRRLTATASELQAGYAAGQVRV